MKMMIALRRVSTPTTPITNRTAEKKRDSASIGLSAAGERDGSDNRGEQQHAGHLEGEEELVKERPGHGLDRSFGGDLRRREVRRQLQDLRRLGASHGEDHRQNGDADRAGD